MNVTHLYRIQLVLAGVGLALSAISLVAEFVGGCGSCRRVDGVGAAVAAAGVVGYGLLLVLGVTNRRTPYAAGIAAAGGVHLALLAWMLQSGRLCPVCIAAAAAALANVAYSWRRGLLAFPMIERAFLPALVVTGAVAMTALAGEGRARVIDQTEEAPLRSGQVRLAIFESEHCPYCRTLREEYIPKLRRDFGGAVEVAFLPADRASWVRWLPTLVVGDESLFEGLPASYEDLRNAIRGALHAGHREDRP